MPVTIPKEVLEAAEQIVTVVNAGDQTVVERFNGTIYRFRPRTVNFVPAARAWLWFGNPNVRGNVREWNAEKSSVENRCGPKFWQYRLDGQFFVREWAEEFGRGREFYGASTELPESMVDAVPMDSIFLGDGADLGLDLRPPSGRAIGVGDEDLADLDKAAVAAMGLPTVDDIPI